MLPYYRSPIESIFPNNNENAKTLSMIETPFKNNTISSYTDNNVYAIDNTNHINVWYRNTAYTASNDPNYTELFSDSNINWMSGQITARLKGVHPEGKNIIVPNKSILGVMDSWYQSTQLTFEMLKEMVILHIVEQITNEYELTAQNSRLSPWVQKYSIDTGLKQFNDIKLNENRGTHFYSWNY
jgi:hypothetical protein